MTVMMAIGDSYGDGDGHSYSDLGGLGHLKNTVYDIFEDISETKFPGFNKAIWLECTQERNEIIFVPSGWYHQVHNLEDTISINHNWFNAHNLSWVWDVLVHDYGEAKEYIEDIKDICDDFEGLCQRNLAANTGMNFNDFFVFIAHMCFANLVQLCYTLRDHRNHNGSLSPVAQHLALNIVYIRQIILKMKSIKGSSGGRGVLLDLEEILDSPKFLELCDGLGKSYRMIHGELKPLSDTKEALLGCIKGLNWTRSYNSSLVQSTQDVINIMDSALSELRGTSGGECISHCLDELLKLEEVRAVS